MELVTELVRTAPSCQPGKEFDRTFCGSEEFEPDIREHLAAALNPMLVMHSRCASFSILDFAPKDNSLGLYYVACIHLCFLTFLSFYCFSSAVVKQKKERK